MGTDPRSAVRRLQAAAEDGQLDELCVRHGIRVLTVFGSAARAESTPRDVDVAVGFERGSRPDLLALIDALAVLTGSDDLDLMVLDRAEPVARERGLVGCLPLYESEPGAYARAQMAAVGERLDTAWLRALELQAMRS